MPNGLFYLNSLNRSISSCFFFVFFFFFLFFFLLFFVVFFFFFFFVVVYFSIIYNRNSCLTANSVDHDQMPRPAASDLGLHCLPMFLL